MKHYLRVAGLIGVLAFGAGASASIAQTATSTASPSLTASIREAVQRARAGAANDAQQAGVVATLADIIVTANVAPVQALASVRLAIAEERCVYENNDWNRWGCAGMASVASSIQQAIGSGPAATVGEGGVAIPPPSAGTGSGGAGN
jgi:hypothetical protein